MRVTRPLFQFDPGWLFLIAGLMLCASGVLLPAQHDLFVLERQRDILANQESHNNARLRTHVEFLDAMEQGDPRLTQRLVASQMNLVPMGERPMLLATDPAGAIAQWLDHAAQIPQIPQAHWPDTTLSRLANGPRRLWLLSGGVMCVFVGLVLSTPTSIRTIKQSQSTQKKLPDVTFELQGVHDLSLPLD